VNYALAWGDEAEALVGVELLDGALNVAFSCWDDLQDSLAQIPLQRKGRPLMRPGAAGGHLIVA
jgi:hypothetical protein